MQAVFEPVKPWNVPSVIDDGFFFYHTIEFPDGSTAEGHWDICGRFDQYIGRYPIKGKTVLDVGTATGFLAFSAEKAGASHVTALDVRGADEFRRIPFRDSQYQINRAAWIALNDYDHLGPMKKAFWYAWHKFNSRVEVVYAPIDKLYAWDRKFDVILAGAIIEHISDPVSAIGAFARLASKAVIIPLTEVVDTDAESMHPTGDWTNSAMDFEWWKLSRGLYRRVFDNLGFDVKFVDATAVYVPGGRHEVTRPTIVAVRRS